MRYLKSEYIKYKRTMINKLLWIAPLFTAFFAWIVGGFVGYQYMTFYWWYAFLMPGTIAIICALSNLSEESAGKYYSVLSLPLNLTKFELSKVIVIMGKIMISAIFLALLTSISNILSPDTVVYSVWKSIIGSLCITVASIWQIPMCLCLSRKVGLILPVILNSVLGILSSTITGNLTLGWLWPYCWAGKLAESLMGIKSNGTFIGATYYSDKIIIIFVLSILLFIFAGNIDARNFSYREEKHK